MGWAQGKFGWGTFGSEGPQFNVTDAEVLGNVQLSLLQPNDGGLTWPSVIWTAAQALSFLNDRMRKFLSESGITVAVAYQAGTAGQTRYPLPDNLQDVRRVAWANEADSMAYVELPRADAWELDHGRTNWPTSSAQSPEVYMEDHLPSLTIEVIPGPTDAGELELTFNADGTIATGITAALPVGTILSVPDDWTPYLAWGVRADMLATEYEGQDPVRAQHCSDRFDEGIELARILVDGEGGQS